MGTSVTTQPTGSGFCRHCGVGLSVETQRWWQGIPHCIDCLDKLQSAVVAGQSSAPRVALPAEAMPRATSYRPTAPASSEGAPSVLLAFVLGTIPGLGAVYNGQYVKGLIHVLMLGSLLTVMIEGGAARLLGLFIPLTIFLVLYQPFEAMRTARAIQRGEEVHEFSGIIGLMFGGTPSTVSSVAWIAMGVVFILHTLGVWELSDVLPFWPLLVILFGVYRLFRAVILKRQAEDELAAEFSVTEPVE